VAWAVAVALAGAAVSCVAALVVLNAVADSVATARALGRARRAGEIDVRTVFAPYVTDAALAGPGPEFAALEAVTTRFLTAGGSVRVKVWTVGGRIAYSDEHRLIGRAFALEPEELALLHANGSRAEVSDLARPENEFERTFEHLLEVNVATSTDSGQPILIETYYPHELVDEAAEEIRGQFFPYLTLIIVTLALVQVPPLTLLTLRLRRARQARAVLLSRLLFASDTERRRVAGEIHDGAIQDLIGLGFALGGAAERAPAAESGQLRVLSSDLSTVIERLRHLLTTIYPPSPVVGNARAIIETLAGALRPRGIDASVAVVVDPPMNQLEEAVVLRAVNELLNNIARHSGATTATIDLRRSRSSLRLAVVDDGVGFDWRPDELPEGHGHFGLRMIADLAADAGGTLTVRRRPDGGTSALLEMSGDQ
jgi:signal transduction histidine kinase